MGWRLADRMVFNTHQKRAVEEIRLGKALRRLSGLI